MKKYIFFILGLIFMSTALFSQSRIDSLENELKDASDKEKLVLLEELIQNYSKTSPQKLIDSAKQGLIIAKKLGLEKEKADFLVFSGDGYFLECDYDQTLNCYYEALRIYEQLNDIDKCGKISKTIADVLYETNQYDKALEFYKKAYDLTQNLNDNLVMATIAHNIATIYAQENEDPVKALEYYFQALELFKELGAEQEIFITLANIGNAYNLLGEFSKALEYLNEALPIAQKMGDRRIDASILVRIAWSFLGKKDFQKAIEYYKKSNDICKNDYPDIRQMNYRGLSDIYLEIQDYKNAYEYVIRTIKVRDSLYTVESEEKIAEIQTKYETEKKEQQIVLLEKDNTIAVMKIKRQKSLLLYLTSGIVLILAFVFILSNLYRQKVKTAAALAVANGKLEELSRTDPLTKLWNRRYMHEIVERERVRIKRAFEPFSFILMDIDHFKNVNDTYGHECGDYVLATMAVILRSAVRKQDVVGRWGGEEFLLFLPSTSLKGALTIAESIRKKIADYPFNYSSTNIAITATLGVSEYEETVSVEACVKLADDALYEGKESGRNRVVSVQEKV